MPEEINLKYRWKRFSSDPETIFHGNDGDCRMGRLQKSIVGTHWLWFMTFQHGITSPFIALSLNGASEDVRKAAAACEACYDAVLAGTWPGITSVGGNLLSREQAMKRWGDGKREQAEEVAKQHLRLAVSNR